MTTGISTPPTPRARPPVELPARWPWLVRGFKRYAVRYLRKHFHAVRISKAGATIPSGDAPILVAMNHSSWWDALTPIALLDEFPRDFEHFPAIDAVAVEKYPFFKRLGFFGVDPHSVRGAASFLRTGEAILSSPNRAVWVTAQGRFTDVRERPLDLRSGVGHLAARMARGFVVPVAVEYPFWNERTPEALIRVGDPLDVTAFPERSGKEWTARIQSALAATMDGLAEDAKTRDPARFRTLIGGTVGVGGVYDRWRRLKSWASGKKFDPSHGGAEA